jgi:chromatin remodeling complex protein RSC6
VNFEDRSSWEFLFRDYWLETKEKQSLTLEVILNAKSQQQTPLTPAAEEKETSDEQANSDNSSAHHAEAEETSSKRKSRKRLKMSKITPSPSSTNKRLKKMRKGKTVLVECSEKRTRPSKNKSIGGHWASEELLDFVAHMRDGDRSVISQFDVQALLLEYIKRKNLRDPRRKSQIICDRMLENLFGKPRVGHFEMLKLLEAHFLEASPTEMDDNQGGGVVDPEPDPEPENSEGTALVTSSEKKRKGRSKGNRAMQGNLDDYAAIDVHNIGLVYLRRNLMEEIIDSEPDEFEEKVVGSFVRIRISNSGQQRHDIYRLVQVVGMDIFP